MNSNQIVIDTRNGTSSASNYSLSNAEDALGFLNYSSGINKLYSPSKDIDAVLANVTIEFPMIPSTVLFSYLICANGIGLMLNLAIAVDLLRRNTIAFSSLILQMAASDIIILVLVAAPEIWSQNTGSWTFGSEMCIAYLGFEVFSGTANIYFLIAICFHAIATANLTARNFKNKKESEEELLEEITEMKSSRHSLVSRNDASPVTKVVETDYKDRPTVPVMIPVVLVWILSMSLSVPEFVLSTTIDGKNDTTICTFLDAHYLSSMRLLLSIFQFIIPLFVLIISTAVIVYKIRKLSTHKQDCTIVCDSLNVLKLSTTLSVMYCVLSIPRSLLGNMPVILLGNLQQDQDLGEGDGLKRFMTPPLNNPLAPAALTLSLAIIHFLASTLRPIIYMCFLRNPRNSLLNNLVKYQRQNQEDSL